MNIDALSMVKFGDKDSLDDFLFENYLEHQQFRTKINASGFQSPSYPLLDVETDKFDDWLQMHQVEHEFFAKVLGLSNPFNMLDADFRKEDDFYEWLAQHYSIHAQITAVLGL